MATIKRPIKPKPKPKPKQVKGKHAGGRPTAMTPLVIAKLEEAFLMGCTDAEACLFANIDKATLYRYQEAKPEFCDRKEVLKSNPVMLSRGVVLEALRNNDLATAHRVIERKDGTKNIVAGDPDAPLSITVIERRIIHPTPRKD